MPRYHYNEMRKSYLAGAAHAAKMVREGGEDLSFRLCFTRQRRDFQEKLAGLRAQYYKNTSYIY